eukprot:9119893-Lingulodinium_polyedra.AAC.1
METGTERYGCAWCCADSRTGKHSRSTPSPAQPSGHHKEYKRVKQHATRTGSLHRWTSTRRS